MAPSSLRPLSGRSRIELILHRGTFLRSEWLGLYTLPNPEMKRCFGCAVRRKAAPQAVERNRLKRWLREAFRRNQDDFPRGADWMAMVFSRPQRLSFGATQEKLLQLAHRLGSQHNWPSRGSASTRPLP